MIGFYLFLIGAYLHYCQSKYYPAGLVTVQFPYQSGLALVLFVAGTALYVGQEGWTSGILLATCALSLALMLLLLTAVLGRVYFYGLIVLAHSFVLLDLLTLS